MATGAVGDPPHPGPLPMDYGIHTSWLNWRVKLDSLSLDCERNDDRCFAGAVWRPPAGKRGAFLLGRLVAVGGHGVRVRRLGGDRAGEIRLTRFLRNAAVTIEEMLAESGRRTAARCADRAVLVIQDTTVVHSEGGGGDYLHAVLARDAQDGAILELVDGQFLRRGGGRKGLRRQAADRRKTELPLA